MASKHMVQVSSRSLSYTDPEVNAREAERFAAFAKCIHEATGVLPTITEPNEYGWIAMLVPPKHAASVRTFVAGWEAAKRRYYDNGGSIAW